MRETTTNEDINTSTIYFFLWEFWKWKTFSVYYYVLKKILQNRNSTYMLAKCGKLRRHNYSIMASFLYLKISFFPCHIDSEDVNTCIARFVLVWLVGLGWHVICLGTSIVHLPSVKINIIIEKGAIAQFMWFISILERFVIQFIFVYCLSIFSLIKSYFKVQL